MKLCSRPGSPTVRFGGDVTKRVARCLTEPPPALKGRAPCGGPVVACTEKIWLISGKAKWLAAQAAKANPGTRRQQVGLRNRDSSARGMRSGPRGGGEAGAQQHTSRGGSGVIEDYRLRIRMIMRTENMRPTKKAQTLVARVRIRTGIPTVPVHGRRA